MQLSGSYTHAVDEKGRLAIPAELRGATGSGPQAADQLHITQFRWRGFPCLHAYYPEEWGRMLDNLASKNPFDPDREDFEFAYIDPMRTCAIDPQGRVVIPKELRDYATIKREVKVTGRVNKIVIWDLATWERAQTQGSRIFEEPARLMNVGWTR
jgi:MraZ protein